MTEQALNEQAVREEIIAPILRALGYRSGTEYDIRHGKYLSLRYPHSYLGRKKPTDPVLTGFADYVCYAKGRISWTIEAKGQEEKITLDTVEQAYTYAKHPEVRSVYFCVCNGKELRLYVSDAAPDQPAILTLSDLTNSEAVVEALRKFVGPEALLRRFANAAGPAFPPLGDTLSSYAQISGGWITHEKQTPPIPGLLGFTVAIVGGALERTDVGLLAKVVGRGPYAMLQRVLERLGLTHLELQSTAAELSADPANPTLFQSRAIFVFPKGELMPNITNGTEAPTAFAITCELTVIAKGTLAGHVVSGPFESHMRYARPEDPNTIFLAVASMGQFSLKLD
jgi:hypothetical protein